MAPADFDTGWGNDAETVQDWQEPVNDAPIATASGFDTTWQREEEAGQELQDLMDSLPETTPAPVTTYEPYVPETLPSPAYEPYRSEPLPDPPVLTYEPYLPPVTETPWQSEEAAPAPLPPMAPEGELAGFIFFEQDGHPDGYAVASGAPGISGRWVSGATREIALANWHDLYVLGALNE